jgi:hypothetical protein
MTYSRGIFFNIYLHDGILQYFFETTLIFFNFKTNILEIF